MKKLKTNIQVSSWPNVTLPKKFETINLSAGKKSFIQERRLVKGKNYSDQIQIKLAAGSHLTYLLWQTDSLTIDSLRTRKFYLATNATCDVITIWLGGKKSHLRQEVYLVGQGAKFRHYLLCLPRDQQTVRILTSATHQAKNTQSQIISHRALFGQSDSEVRGLINIAAQGQGSEGSFADQVLAISQQAINRSIPALAINTSEVKASHNSSQSAIAPVDLLYLQQRGISRSEAQSLLIRGFLARVYEGLINPTVSREISAKIDKIIDHVQLS